MLLITLNDGYRLIVTRVISLKILKNAVISLPLLFLLWIVLSFRAFFKFLIPCLNMFIAIVSC